MTNLTHKQTNVIYIRNRNVFSHMVESLTIAQHKELKTFQVQLCHAIEVRKAHTLKDVVKLNLPQLKGINPTTVMALMLTYVASGVTNQPKLKQTLHRAVGDKGKNIHSMVALFIWVVYTINRMGNPS